MAEASRAPTSLSIQKARFYNESDFAEVLDLSGMDGKTIQAVAEVAQSGQIILCLYRGDALFDIATDYTTISGDGETKLVRTSITLPTFDEGTECRLSAYVWNSLEGMKPIAGVNSISTK